MFSRNQKPQSTSQEISDINKKSADCFLPKKILLRKVINLNKNLVAKVKKTRKKCKANVLGKCARLINKANVQGKCAWQKCKAKVQGKSTRQKCKAKVQSKSARQTCKAKVQGKTHTSYARQISKISPQLSKKPYHKKRVNDAYII